MLAHDVAGGSLPAPSWLIGYIGAFVVLITAVSLRSAWPAARLALASPETDEPVDPASDAIPSVPRRIGHSVGLLLLIAVFAIAIAGPDSGAANLAPTSVLVVWWVGLPLVCLLVGDVMAAVNPFAPAVRLLVQRRETTRPPAPPWTAAAFVAAFSWFLLAYHRPGSPSALAVFLAVYVIAALAGALWWGPVWLRDGEGFAGLSRAIALLSPRRGGGPPAGLLALVVVWLGGTAFKALSLTTFWLDVLGTNRGWDRTFLDTVGLVWMIGTVAAVALAILHLTERRSDGDERAASATRLGLALVPLAFGWFLAQNLSFLLLEGQNFYILLSDPIGRGWDLFGTIDHTPDYQLAQGEWIRWAQMGALLATHVACVVLAHDGAIASVGRRQGLRTTWCVAVAASASIVAAAMLVVG